MLAAVRPKYSSCVVFCPHTRVKWYVCPLSPFLYLCACLEHDAAGVLVASGQVPAGSGAIMAAQSHISTRSALPSTATPGEPSQWGTTDAMQVRQGPDAHPCDVSGAAMAMLVADVAWMLIDGSHCGSGPEAGGLMRNTTCRGNAEGQSLGHPRFMLVQVLF